MLDPAEEDCRAAVQPAPGVGLPYAALGHTLALKGKFAEALEEFRKGIELDRSLAEIFKAELEYCRARAPEN